MPAIIRSNTQSAAEQGREYVKKVENQSTAKRMGTKPQERKWSASSGSVCLNTSSKRSISAFSVGRRARNSARSPPERRAANVQNASASSPTCSSTTPATKFRPWW